MKRWGKHFYFLLAVFWILGLSGCGESSTVAIDGAEVQTTEVEEEHWISVEGLQEYGFALQKGDKMTGSLETNWVLYPLSPDMKTVEKEEIAYTMTLSSTMCTAMGCWFQRKSSMEN